MQTQALEVYENALAHDIRELNKQLKVAAEVVCDVFKRNRNIIGKEEAYGSTVYFASEMITKRLDIYDFYANSSKINTRERRYQLHRVLIKLSKILNQKAQRCGVRIQINESYAEVSSSNNFETAIFVVMENFIKYAPQKETVLVNITETSDEVRLTISAPGPMATEEEQKSVFSMGTRAKMAKKHSNEGSGIGLNFAKAICDIHNFNISFSQDSSRSLSREGIDFHYTTVEIDFPKNL